MTRDHGWGDEQTLVVMRGLNATVARWLDAGGADWNDLRDSLQRTEEELRSGFS
jgi:hypothetical protein